MSLLGSGTGCSDSIRPPGGGHRQFNIADPRKGSGGSQHGNLAPRLALLECGMGSGPALDSKLVTLWKAAQCRDMDFRALGTRRRE